MADGILMKQLSLAVFVIAVFTDWYDGWHARKFGMVSKVGIFLDPLADKVLTSFAFILFYFLEIMPLWMIIIIIVRDIVITVLRSYHEYKGYTMETSYFAKVKTFIQMTYIFVVLAFIFTIELNPSGETSLGLRNFLYSEFNYYLMLFVTLLTAFTGIQYFFTKKTIVPELENN